VKSAELIRALNEAASSAGGEPIHPFATSPSAPAFTPAEVRKLARYARSAVGDLLKTLDSRIPGQKHAATYLLGLSGDRRAVRPLHTLLIRQRDWFDHDYACAALGQLGDVALPFLERRATLGKPAEAALTMRAIAESRGDTLPALRRIRSKRRRLPEGFHSAFTDPRGLSDLVDALDDRRSRSEALAAAQEILVGRGHGRIPAARRRTFSQKLAKLLDSRDVDVRAQALVCIGRLGDLKQLPAVREALSDPNDDVVAAATGAIAHLGATEDLVALLHHRSIQQRSLAAASLLQAGGVRGATKRDALAALVEAATGPGGGWLRERTVLAIEGNRAATTALVAAMKTLRGVRRRRAAEALVQIARLKKRPAAAHARMRKGLRGDARRELDRAWASSERAEARIQVELGRLRRSDFPRSRP